MAQTGDNNIWNKHLQATKHLQASPLLEAAISHIAEKEQALDLGAGALHDTRYLLSEGFAHVDVVDKNPQVEEMAADLEDKYVSIHIKTFEDFNFVPGTYDLVNAQWAIPFVAPGTFTTLFDNIKMSLKRSSVFAGQIFGDRDEWNDADHTSMTFLTRTELEGLLSDCDIILFEEEEKDAQTALGDQKHWHFYNVIFRKTT